MTRARDLDTVAPDDQVIMSPKVDTNLIKEEFAAVKDSGETMKKKEVVKNTPFEDLSEKVYEIVGHTKHPFSSLLVNPHVFDFEERDSNEKIILVARPHWFTNVSWVLTAILLIVSPALLKFIPLIGSIPSKFQLLGIVAWYLVTFAFIFEKFLSWWIDVYIITDERVIDIAFNNLLDKKFSEAKISMIQDITSRVSGVAQTMFNYGNVMIQTAAEIPEITFEMVPHPEKIIKILQVLRDEEEQEAIDGRVR